MDVEKNALKGFAMSQYFIDEWDIGIVQKDFKRWEMIRYFYFPMRCKMFSLFGVNIRLEFAVLRNLPKKSD